eukprot:gene5008-6236_t
MSNQTTTTTISKTTVSINNEEIERSQFMSLLGLDEPKIPTSFQFNSDQLFFLQNTINNQLNIHYVDLKYNTNDPTLSPSPNTREIKPLFNVNFKSTQLTLEEILIRERQRIMSTGISSYKYDEKEKQFITAVNGKIFTISVKDSVKNPVIQEIPGDTYDHKLSSDGKVVSFIKNGDIWITDIATSNQHRITFGKDKSSKILSGLPGFVYSEEFCRYTGYWWSPRVSLDQDGNNVYSLFYIEEDETDVMDFYIPEPGYKGKTTHYKYPLAGQKNSTSRLCIVNFTLPNQKNLNIQINQKYLFRMEEQQFPWLEYYVRGGWVPDGNSVWVQILDRKQSKLALVLIPLTQFNETPSKLPVLLEENTKYWINVTNLYYFFGSGNKLLWTDETTSGFRQLYLISWDEHYGNIIKKPITSVDSKYPEWVVSGSKLWVDETKQLVYFVASRDSPLENHLYVASFADNSSPTEIQRLTQNGFNHLSIEISSDFTKFVSTFSNVSTPHKTEAHELIYSESERFPITKTLFFITPIGINKPPSFYKVPELFNFTNSKGQKIYGQVIKPHNYNPSIKYRSIICVYGGPTVQYVRNQFSHLKQVYGEYGIVVVMIDNIGTSNRGMEFEGEMKWKMGQIEIRDQVEGWEYVVQSGLANLDRSKIAITGWSYGGYLSLMALCQRPDFFKIAISGAPVTFWEAYNTGYTERYMDTPENNPIGYKEGSVLNYIGNFPNEEGRLIVIHGSQDENVHFANTEVLMEELTNNGKPYILKILSKERHAIRNMNTRVYIEQHNLNHLLKNL